MPLVAHKYMPEAMPVEALRSTFAARENTLEYLTKALREQIDSRTLTSFLLVGPRGSGKTTLVLMLCDRIRSDSDLVRAWLPVRFPEEIQGVGSLRDLVAQALANLAEEGLAGADEWQQRAEAASD